MVLAKLALRSFPEKKNKTKHTHTTKGTKDNKDVMTGLAAIRDAYPQKVATDGDLDGH